MKARANKDDGLGFIGIVLLLVVAVLFGRLLAGGIDKQIAVEDAQRAAHKRMLVSE